MAWWDARRRRAVATDPAGRSTPSATAGASGPPGAPRSPEALGALGEDRAPVAAGPASGARERDAVDAVRTSVPGDWDGGWRRTAPPTPTLSRAPLGVSDGLAFRAGLAAWQDPSLGTSLGHAVLPSAPFGLVHGMTRPASPLATHAAGGPLLLRVPRRDAEETGGAGAARGIGPDRSAPAPRPGRGAAGDSRASAPQAAAADHPPAAGDAPARHDAPAAVAPAAVAPPPPSRPAPPVGTSAAPALQRSPLTPPSRPPTTADTLAPVTSRDAAAQRSTPGPAGQPVRPTGQAVRPGDPATEPAIPLVRRVAVVPYGGPARPRTAAEAGRARRPDPVPKGPSLTRPEPQLPTAADASGTTDTHGGRVAVVRPRAPGPSLTVARRTTGPVRRVMALRPTAAVTGGTANAPGGNPGVGPTTGTAGAPAAIPPASRTAAPTRPDSRSPLGAPLSELPATARPLPSPGPSATGRRSTLTDAHPPAGPDLPIVQRQAVDAPVPATGPHGTDLATPPDRDGPASSAPIASTTPTSATPPRPASPQSTSPRSAPSGPTGRPSHPDPSGARTRGGLGAPLPSLPPTAGPPRSAAESGAAPAAPDARRTAPTRAYGSGPDAPKRPSGPPARSAPILGTATAPQHIHATNSHTLEVSSPQSAVQQPDTPLATPAGPRSSPGAAPGSVQRLAAPDPPTTTAGGRAPHGGPVVVAQAVPLSGAASRAASGIGGSQAAGAVDRPPPAPRPATVRRTRALLSARPLPVHTRAPEGAAPPPSGARTARRPVVAASWRRAPDTAPDAAPDTAPAARDMPPAPAGSGHPSTPQVQRAASGPAATDRVNSSAERESYSPSREAIPRVRPQAPARPTAVRPQALPLSDPQASLPSAPQAPLSSGAPAVPVVQREVPGAGGGAVAAGVPVTEVPAHGRRRAASAPPAHGAAPDHRAKAPEPTAARPAEAPHEPGIDLDDLARRLLDPVSRLLRADLRRGRERAGRPHDGRR
ncbi:hypothetical protein [Streptomyces noursei]|uniref:hypothetical protein n=1 Tax=Streptomyces noursei TaxID=1971 RepID=UPI00380169AB